MPLNYGESELLNQLLKSNLFGRVDYLIDNFIDVCYYDSVIGDGNALTASLFDSVENVFAIKHTSSAMDNQIIWS